MQGLRHLKKSVRTFASTSTTNSFKVENPYTLEAFCEVQRTSDKESVKKLEKAVRAQKQWKNTTLKSRQDILKKWIAVLKDQKEVIANDITGQMGKPISQAVGEMNGAMQRTEVILELSNNALKPDSFPIENGLFRQITKESLGVVFVIAPWNYPMMTVVNCVVPTLLAGNAVLLKHSPQTPLCGDHFESTLLEAGLPKGLLSSIHCSHDTAAQLIKNSDVKFISFTGSVQGGKQIFKTIGANRIINSTLELGGKDAMYVAQDADLEAAAAGVVDGACYNAGQSCCGVERVYVHESHYEKFLSLATNHFNAYKLGDPMHKSTTLGPMALPAAIPLLQSHVQDALEKGGRLLSKEDFDMQNTGRFFKPTLIADCTHDMKIMSDESFGPILGVAKVKSDEEAIVKMNANEYGLTAGIFTTSQERALHMGKQLEAGTIYMNRCDAVDSYLPWTGVKNSGKGASLSKYGFDSLTQLKSWNFKL